MLEHDGAAAVVSIFVEDDGIATWYVDRTDAVVPEIIGINGRPFAGDGKGGAAVAVVFEGGDGRSGEVTTVAATTRATDMRSRGALVMRAAMMSDGDEANGGDTIVPVTILSAGPLASNYQVFAAKATVLEEVSFVASWDDEGVDGVVPVIMRAVHRPIGVDV